MASHVNLQGIEICPGEITPYAASGGTTHQAMASLMALLAVFALAADDMQVRRLNVIEV
jgi:hypothetical protein